MFTSGLSFSTYQSVGTVLPRPPRDTQHNLGTLRRKSDYDRLGDRVHERTPKLRPRAAAPGTELPPRRPPTEFDPALAHFRFSRVLEKEERLRDERRSLVDRYFGLGSFPTLRRRTMSQLGGLLSQRP